MFKSCEEFDNLSVLINKLCAFSHCANCRKLLRLLFFTHAKMHAICL